MPYWSVYCLYCHGYIIDALLECVPAARRADPAFKLLFQAKPGAALACPYCDGLIGFDDQGQPAVPQSGWPVFRYGEAEIEMKKVADGEPTTTSDADWALRCRFVQPGTHPPLTNYTMPSKHPPMKLSPDEELFLRHWVYEEAHFQDGVGPAKRLQVEHRIVPADLAALVAAAIPDPAAQERAALNPPADPPRWPWTADGFRMRLAEAKHVLSSR